MTKSFQEIELEIEKIRARLLEIEKREQLLRAEIHDILKDM